MAKAIVKTDVKLPPCDFNRGKFAIFLENVLTPKECQNYIDITEKKGYEKALLNIGGGREILETDVRKSSRCIWDSEEEAAKLWERVKDVVPEVFEARKVIGLNERLRFLRYDPGDYFKPHMDGCYTRPTGERSRITLQLYLNEGFQGGCTTFFDYLEEKKEPVVPKTGSVLIFEHSLMHEGSLLKKGRKYAMRTDVMYSKEKVAA